MSSLPEAQPGAQGDAGLRFGLFSPSLVRPRPLALALGGVFVVPSSPMRCLAPITLGDVFAIALTTGLRIHRGFSNGCFFPRFGPL